MDVLIVIIAALIVGGALLLLLNNWIGGIIGLVVGALLGIGIVAVVLPLIFGGTDLCNNIPGTQGSVPAGMSRDANGNCVVVVVVPTPVVSAPATPIPGLPTAIVVVPTPVVVAPTVVVVPTPVVIAPPSAAGGKCFSSQVAASYGNMLAPLQEGGATWGAQLALTRPLTKSDFGNIQQLHVNGNALATDAPAGSNTTVWFFKTCGGVTDTGSPQAAPAAAPAAVQAAPAAQAQAGAPQGAPASASGQDVAKELVKYLEPTGNAVHDGKIGGYQGKVKSIPSAEILQNVHVDRGGTRITDPSLLKLGEVVTVWVPDGVRPLPDFKSLR